MICVVSILWFDNILLMLTLSNEQLCVQKRCQNGYRIR